MLLMWGRKAVCVYVFDLTAASRKNLMAEGILQSGEFSKGNCNNARKFAAEVSHCCLKNSEFHISNNSGHRAHISKITGHDKSEVLPRGNDRDLGQIPRKAIIHTGFRRKSASNNCGHR